jgi:DNA-directed RNA polymerase sigma subunit (sigma70/sigma32)
MTFDEIGRREGISGEAARQCFENGMAKLRHCKRREAIAVMQFYSDALQAARRGEEQIEAIF